MLTSFPIFKKKKNEGLEAQVLKTHCNEAQGKCKWTATITYALIPHDAMWQEMVDSFYNGSPAQHL